MPAVHEGCRGRGVCLEQKKTQYATDSNKEGWARISPQIGEIKTGIQWSRDPKRDLIKVGVEGGRIVKTIEWMRDVVSKKIVTEGTYRRKFGVIGGEDSGKHTKSVG